MLVLYSYDVLFRKGWVPLWLVVYLLASFWLVKWFSGGAFTSQSLRVERLWLGLVVLGLGLFPVIYKLAEHSAILGAQHLRTGEAYSVQLVLDSRAPLLSNEIFAEAYSGNHLLLLDDTPDQLYLLYQQPVGNGIASFPRAYVFQLPRRYINSLQIDVP